MAEFAFPILRTAGQIQRWITLTKGSRQLCMLHFLFFDFSASTLHNLAPFLSNVFPSHTLTSNFKDLKFSLRQYVCIYIYIYICVCVCVCAWEREGEIESKSTKTYKYRKTQWIFVFPHTHTYTHTHSYTHTHTSLSLYIYIYIYMRRPFKK